MHYEDTLWRNNIHKVPWQIWVVVVFLALEGIFNNLPIIFVVPAAMIWFGTKCLFILGLLRGWRWVFVVSIIVTTQHVLAFSMDAPFIAFINLVMVLLTASALRYYFPVESDDYETYEIYDE
jgi:hypothetical protein